MTRIAIIDHDAHNLIVEDIDDEILESKYGGEEEAYIKDNYKKLLIDSGYYTEDQLK